MPTQNPKIQVVVDKDIYNKFKKICEKEKRSLSNMAAKIIIEWINKEEMK